MNGKLTVEMEAIIIRYALLHPEKSYLAHAEDFERQGFPIAAGVIRGVFRRNGMNTLLDRLKVIENDYDVRGVPVDLEIQKKLLKQQRRLADSGILHPTRRHEVVVWDLISLRLIDNRMIHISIFFDLFTNRAEAFATNHSNDVRLMEALDMYLVAVRSSGQMLPDNLITSASPAVAGNPEKNLFRARLARDGIKHLISNPRSSNIYKHVNEYSRQLKLLLNEVAPEFTQAIKIYDHKLLGIAKDISDLANLLNEKWQNKPLFEGPICGLPIEEK
ncbi:MAG: hypothetical protein ABTQ25_13990 [Nitrosomonas ureae]